MIAPFRRRGPDAQKLIELKRDKHILERMVQDRERVEGHRNIFRHPESIVPCPVKKISSEMSRKQPLRQWQQMDLFLLSIPVF